MIPQLSQMLFFRLFVFVEGPSQCSYMSLSFAKIDHIGYINPAHFSQNSFIYEIWCLFTFCPYSVNITESS